MFHLFAILFAILSISSQFRRLRSTHPVRVSIALHLRWSPPPRNPTETGPPQPGADFLLSVAFGRIEHVTWYSYFFSVGSIWVLIVIRSPPFVFTLSLVALKKTRTPDSLLFPLLFVERVMSFVVGSEDLLIDDS